MKREKVMFGVEFSLGEKGVKSARKMSALLRHMEVPALGFNLRVDVTGEPLRVPEGTHLRIVDLGYGKGD